MEYTEVFYIQQPAIDELGVPKNLVAPQAAPAQPYTAHTAKQSKPLPPASPAPAVVVKAVLPAKATYSITGLPSEEELAASVASLGSA